MRTYRSLPLLLPLALSLAACARSASTRPSTPLAASAPDDTTSGANRAMSRDSLTGAHGAGHDHAAHQAQMAAERARREAAAHDSSFASLQVRGAEAMGVDQYTSSHVFEDLPDGGRIELQTDRDDPAGAARIRDHLRAIARAFAAGDFATPGFVHADEVPGTRVLAERRASVTYAFAPLPRGGEVRITTRDAAALGALREFLAYQRQEHHAR